MPRTIPAGAAAKFKQRIQAPATNAKPRVDLFIGRPITPMVTNYFFERQIIYHGSSLTKTDVAVEHANKGKQSGRIYIAYIDGGHAYLKSAEWKVRMDNHIWLEEDFDELADDVAIAFDSTLEKLNNGNEEFVTGTAPWLFWCKDGFLYCRMLGDTETVALATANVTAVSAVRATWSELADFDFGLIVFFVIAGALYYRQLIDGVWYDAEQVPDSILSQSLTYTDVSASRTWDYRIVLQAITDDGTVYEAYSQYGGIGTRNQEHIQIENLSAQGATTEVQYMSSQGTENVQVSQIRGSAAIHSTLVPSIIRAFNADDGEGNWGKLAVFVFDVDLDAEQVSENEQLFTIRDSLGATYTATSAVLSSDLRTVVLTFADFNAARGSCTATFTGGTITTCAGTLMETVTLGFTPENLVPPAVDPPEPERLWNITSDGTDVHIEFTEPITSFLSTAEEAFSVSIQEYEYLPEGALQSATRQVESVAYLTGVSQDLDLDSGTYTDTEFTGGVLCLEEEEEEETDG